MKDQFKWPRAENEVDEIIIRNVRRHGCHIVGILPEQRDPGYDFSIGLFLNYGQAELVIFGLEDNDGAGVINSIRDRAAAGQKYVAGDVCDGLPIDRSVCFVEVPTRAYPEYFGTALWFYSTTRRPFPILQIVWPDRGGCFPWQTGCDASLKQYQPVLKSFS
jgi:hypothetical protein